MLFAACLLFGCAAAAVSWLLISFSTGPRLTYGMADSFEKERREQLRDSSFVYRHFEVLVDELAGINNSDFTSLQKSLSTAGISERWKGREFVATNQIISFIYSCSAFVILKYVFGYSTFIAAVSAIAVFFIFLGTAVRGIHKRSLGRRKKIKRDFAAALDLLALMIGVGGGFVGSLKVVAKEFSGRDIGLELGMVVQDIELGKPRKQALNSFADRMQDDDISEVVFACNESEELGVPISETLELQADKIRQKRSDWAESAAQEAEISLTFPAMVIMVACILTVVMPFALSSLSAWGS